MTLKSRSKGISRQPTWTRIKFCFYLACFALAVFSSLQCQHARIVIPATNDQPGNNKNGKNVRSGGVILAKAPAAGTRLEESHVTVELSHTYFLMGLLPRNVVIEEGVVCPGARVHSMHQYTSFRDGVLEQLSLGIYSPRTVEIVCSNL